MQMLSANRLFLKRQDGPVQGGTKGGTEDRQRDRVRGGGQTQTINRHVIKIHPIIAQRTLIRAPKPQAKIHLFFT